MDLQGLRFGIKIANIQMDDQATRMDVQLEKPEKHLSPVGIQRYKTHSNDPQVPELASKVVDLGDRFTLIAEGDKVVGQNASQDELELPREIVVPLLAATLKDNKVWKSSAEALGSAVQKFINTIGGDRQLDQTLSERLR